jgi:SP family general alpha glucoside:H+ symporter-like MFS transporter
MSDFISEKPTSISEIEAGHPKVENVHDVVEKVDYNRAGAIEAENSEHRMSVLQAVRAYPSASWWAFVMSATIVSSVYSCCRAISLTVNRSWSHTVSS